VSDTADLLRAIAWLLWPLLVVLLLWFAWRGRTALGAFLRGRGFTIRLPGGLELTLQEAADQERRLIGDLTDKIADQEERLLALERPPEPDSEEEDEAASEQAQQVESRDEGTGEDEGRRGFREWIPAVEEPGPGPPQPRRALLQAKKILWLGQNYRADASLATAAGVGVVFADTIDQALDRITLDIEAIISELYLSEGENGLTLLDKLRERPHQPPVAFYEPRGVAGLGNWNKHIHLGGGYGLAMSFPDLESVLRSAGVSLFPVRDR
jgi:hypothetical protein